MPKDRSKSNAASLQHKIARAEKKIEKLEQEKVALETKLSAPGFYKTEGDKIAETQNRYNRLLQELALCESEWREAQS